MLRIDAHDSKGVGVICLVCRSGGTGRRTGLKILRDLYSRTGSIPVFGTMFFKIIYRGSLVKRSRHRPFTAVTGVRFPYESPILAGVAQW